MPELDGLRGVACLLVLLWHLVHGQLPDGPGPWGLARSLLSQCWSGVDLFFVLSGYLILDSLLDREDRARPITGFILARGFRLLPAYFLLLGAYALACREFGPSPDSRPIQLLLADRPSVWLYGLFGQSWDLVFTQRTLADPFGSRFLSVTWSLAAEVEYYLGAIVIVLFVKRERRAMVFASLALTAILIRAGIVLYAPASSPAAYVLPPARMDGFAWGALVACAFRSEPIRRAAAARVGSIAPVLLALAAGVAFLIYGNCAFSGKFAANFSYTWMALFYTTALVWVVLSSGVQPVSLLARGPLTWLGAISYSVFLFHLPLHYLFSHIGSLSEDYLTHPGGLRTLALEIVFTLFFGALSYRFVERPFIELGRRWGSGRVSGRR